MSENQSHSSPADPPPDDLIEVRDGTNAVTARAALWWSHTPVLDGIKTGVIGSFEATTDEAAHQVLAEAVARLRAAGAGLALGPMDGSTWRRYRWMVASDGRGPFFLEPWNPPAYPQWWKESGFECLASYTSSVVDANCPPGASAAVRKRFEQSGFVIRQLDPARFEAELGIIHDLSLRSFTGNFLYSPLSREAFVADYAKVSAVIDPECVLIVERAGEPCAFLFAIPDLAASRRGEKASLIAKTIAVLPEQRRHGIGSILLDELQGIARRKGYGEIIHALQHEHNRSLAITARLRHRVFRRYELLAKRI